MKSITTTGVKSQNPQVDYNLRINELCDRLRDSKSPEESRELLAFFTEATEEGAVKNWLQEFQRIFQLSGSEATQSLVSFYDPQIVETELVVGIERGQNA